MESPERRPPREELSAKAWMTRKGCEQHPRSRTSLFSRPRIKEHDPLVVLAFVAPSVYYSGNFSPSGSLIRRFDGTRGPVGNCVADLQTSYGGGGFTGKESRSWDWLKSNG